jgi:hypothetical protein
LCYLVGNIQDVGAMPKQLFFDTLQHARILEKNGVSHADIHANALADSFKYEVDQMLEIAIKEMQKQIHDLELEVREINNKVVQRLTINIGIIVAVLTLLSATLHYMIH